MDSGRADGPKTTYLKDYRPPDYTVATANLQFDLDETRTRVKSHLVITPNYDIHSGVRPLVLYGRDLKLIALLMNGRRLNPDEYSIDDETLVIFSPPPGLTLEIETEINPADNTSLTGLYMSGGNFYTQCEPEGFRRMTYYPDRPDVMARFFTTITADKKRYPVLLSNGNPIGRGELAGGRHFAKWHDPFPKPSYLFALVAGDLARVEDEFVTMSGRKVALHIYVQRHNTEKCGHALSSLKRAMKWDEDVYGLEYDLDLFMIVATDDFNMGAMENKGLNIFNSKYVLARPATATDTDFQSIEGIVAHEYFHNWSGNRVTCRDWFQLSLKEGFTVFRDQQFMEDMTSRGVKRISDVNVLRTHQFREDSGPMAHPVRPESYVEINNFYTTTVYNKGAEVVRMLRTLLGPEGFRKGTDLYFSRHDGQAVTTDDFVKAMEDANGVDLSQFRLWYSQAGTPELHVTRSYDPVMRTYKLAIRQTIPATPGQPEKRPMHIPFALGLLGRDGRDMPLVLEGEEADEKAGGTRILELKKEEESFVFVNIPHEPVPSFLRGFSAPVKLHTDLTEEELLFIMAHDSDEFSRWEAGQQLMRDRLLKLVSVYQAKRPLVLDRPFIEAFRKILESRMEDMVYQAFALTLPSETYLAEFMEVIDPEALHEARRFALRTIAEELKDIFLSVYEENEDRGAYSIDQKSIGKRSMRNLCLGYLMETGDPYVRGLCMKQFLFGGNMTNVLAALSLFANIDCPERGEVLDYFYHRWKDDPLVMDKWLAIQAASRLENTLENVKALTRHPVFNLKNPNKVRALIGTFAQVNQVRYHDPSGAGYEFLSDFILRLDPINPQIAARLSSAFTQWKRYDDRRKALMKRELEKIQHHPGLSRDVYEIVSKSLA